MAYIGNDLQVAYQNYKIIDDISSSFDGSTTSFALLVGGVTPVPFPINEQQCLISVGGVIQEPDPTGANGFKFSGGNIIFSSAPGTGENFFGVILAGADYVDAGVKYSSGSESAPSITFETDLASGIYNPALNELGFVTNTSEAIRINSSGNVGINTTIPNAKLHVAGTYNILKGFNRRPPLHRGPLFYKTAASTISITANCALNGFFYEVVTAVTMPGSLTNNTDYAIWQHPTTGALVADSSFITAPTGATGGSIVGGFHYIPSGRPTAVNSGSPTTTPEILEYSIWDLTWHPTCPDPRGMTCIDGRFWCDLYFCGSTSYAGSDFTAVPSSKIGLTVANTEVPPLVPASYGGDGITAYTNVGSAPLFDVNAGCWHDFCEVASSFSKRLLTFPEFQLAAFGAPEESSGSSPSSGSLPVAWERVSKWGLAQATGLFESLTSSHVYDLSYTVLQTILSLGPGGFIPLDYVTDSTRGRGNPLQPDGVYNFNIIVCGGEGLFAGSNSGSRYWEQIGPNYGFTVTSARFACDHTIDG